MKPVSFGTRRSFLQQAFLGAAGCAALGPGAASVGAAGAARRVRLGVMGTNGRGSDLARGFSALEGVEIGYICDVDERAIGKGIESATGEASRTPKGVGDFRRILDDPDIDGLVVAAPDHWHGPAAIMACAAGKHVYVEKPASHNPQEGEWMIAAARKHGRVIQVGTQRRSMPRIVEAIERVRAGELGRVRFARGWYNNVRGSIGRGKPAPVPDWLDWTLWQGPAPERGFRDNVVHYNWHWFWHWGTGELGNNGIHALDLCLWGLDVRFPRRVTAGGGRYHHDDDQETPDTMIASYDYGDCMISWEGRSCQRHGFEGSMFGAAFFGDQGTLVIDGSGYRLYDRDDKELTTVGGSGSDAPHLQNFIDAVREEARPRAGVETGHCGAMLCHLGNIAWRTGQTLYCDDRTGRVVNDAAAMKLWRRTYRPGWEPEF